VRRCSSAPAAAATFFPTAGRPRFIVSGCDLLEEGAPNCDKYHIVVTMP